MQRYSVCKKIKECGMKDFYVQLCHWPVMRLIGARSLSPVVTDSLDCYSRLSLCHTGIS